MAFTETHNPKHIAEQTVNARCCVKGVEDINLTMFDDIDTFLPTAVPRPSGDATSKTDSPNGVMKVLYHLCVMTTVFLSR